MKKIAISTDSNSGITQAQAKQFGIFVLPMPFMMNSNLYFEDIDLTQEEFYKNLSEDAEISTSQPSIGSVTDYWNDILKQYDEIVHIPMTKGLSTSYQSAVMISQEPEFHGKVFVVDNRRISVTQRQSALDALSLANSGKSAKEIKEILEKAKYDTGIYIMVDTLKYLKKGGRVTPAGAAIGTLLNVKPILSIKSGEKLDAYKKVRGIKQGKAVLIEAIKQDLEENQPNYSPDNVWIEIAYTFDKEAALEFKEEVQAEFPDYDIVLDPLSLSVSCHIGPGALAVAYSKKIKID